MSDSEQNLHRTPNSKSRRKTNESYMANMKYAIEFATHPPSSLPSYIRDVIKTVEATHWASINQHPDVQHAYDALKVQPLKAQKYAYVTYLLNTISLAYIDVVFPNAGPDTQVVFFDSPHLHVTRGDYLGTESKPDWVAFLMSLAALRSAVNAARNRLRRGKKLIVKSMALAQGWPRLLAVGEGKPGNSDATDHGQFLVYLRSLKTYRPDLLVVHGFQLNDTRLRLASQNACSTVVSPYLGRSEDEYQIHGWIAHVVRVYTSESERDAKIVHCPPEDDIVRCDVTLGNRIACIAPVYGSRPPGRMTWVGFEIGGDPNVLDSVCTKDCVGVVKVSYQDTQGKFKEGELLDRVHADGWLPGVVRHTFWEREEARKVGDVTLPDNDPNRIVRVKETIHLGSVGDPLSQCSTPLQMLKVAYDAAETHLQLLKRGVLHRDLSWFNILCNPWHNPNTLDTKAVLTGIPCIDYILTGESNTEPHCLIADFDHAAVFSEIHKAGYQGRLERTATAMFSALEISTDKPLERVLDPFALDNVIRKLRAVEQLPVFDRAFPDGKGDFVEMLEAVTELEFTRKRFLSKSADRKAANDIRQRFTDPKKILHDPCYDVQSIYWSLLWFFLRALPTGKPPLDVLDGDFSRFANSLLEHTVGDDAFRADHFFQWRGPTLELHPALTDFVPLFQNLAAYLAIPWHMYKNHPEVHVPNDHAHTAVRRLLLAEIYALTKENKGLNIALDPTQPRIINKSTSAVTDRSKQPAFRDSTRTSKRRAADAGLDEGHSDGKRRKVEDSEDDDDDSDSDEEAEAKAPSTLPNPGRVVPGHRCYVRKCNPKSAGARAEKLRDDRYLFFGVGSRKPLQTAAAATGN